MTPRQAIAFVRSKGVVLESARGPVPSLAEAIAGEPIRGSYLGHPKANNIFLCTRAIRKSRAILVCRLVQGKVTYVHRRLWPALVKIASRFDTSSLGAIHEVHTASGKHVVTIIPYPEWVPQRVREEARGLTEEAAAARLDAIPNQSWQRGVI